MKSPATMRTQWAGRFAWSLCGAALTLLAASFAVSSLQGLDLRTLLLDWSLATYLYAAAFALVGALIASRRSENWMGWLFLAFGLGPASATFARQYATYSLGGSVDLPGGAWAAWLVNWVIPLNMAGSLVFVLLLFPTGKLLSARWRPVAWLAGAAPLTGVVGKALGPSEVARDIFAGTPNPMGFMGGSTAAPLVGLYETTWPIAFLSGVVCLIIRFRRASGLERQQVKWFVYGCAVASVVLAVTAAVSFEAIGTAALSLVLIPVTAAVSILRYRLYDIDRIISRTLAYGFLTAFLGGIYFGVVLLLQTVVGGGIGEQPLVVAATTLAVAALFRPARARIQGVIDRRFNRRKYDAQQTAEAFSSRLREEIDLSELSADLLAVVGDTVQPAHASLWLREAPTTAVDS